MSAIGMRKQVEVCIHVFDIQEEQKQEVKRKENKKDWWIFVAHTKSKIRLDFQGEDKAYASRSHDKKVPDS